MKYEKEATQIIELVGGKNNISNLVHCATRLRFTLVDDSIANKESLNELPYVISVVQAGGQYQVVVGSKVSQYYQDIKSIIGLDSDHQTESKKKINFNYIFEVISGSFSPLIPALAGSGMIKAVLTVLATMNVLSDTSSTYAVLNASSNAVFYFLPIFLGLTLTQKLGGNMYIGAIIGASLLEPSFTSLIDVKGATFLGIPLEAVDYSTTIFPIFIAIIIYSFLDRFLKKYIYEDIQLFAVPMISLMIMVPLTALIFGPFGTIVGDGISAAVMWLINTNRLISGIVIGGGMPFMVMLGLHWGFAPITIENLNVLGGDPIEGIAVAAVFAQIGIAIGFYLKAKKHSEMKSLTGPLILTGLLAGVTEPIVYGLILRYKRLLPITAISGAVGGAICGMFNVTMNAYVFHHIFSIPVYTPKVGYFLGIIASLITGLVLSYFFGVKEDEMKDFVPNETGFNGKVNEKKSEMVYSPMAGEVIALDMVDDNVFSSGMVGKGLAIQPTDGKVVSPFEGEVTAVFPSKHAIGLKSYSGIEVLIHIGLNTVELEGKYFDVKKKVGDHISKGEVLLSFDIDKIKEEGYSLVSPVLITNLSDGNKIDIIKNVDVINQSDCIFTIY